MDVVYHTIDKVVCHLLYLLFLLVRVSKCDRIADRRAFFQALLAYAVRNVFSDVPISAQFALFRFLKVFAAAVRTVFFPHACAVIVMFAVDVLKLMSAV